MRRVMETTEISVIKDEIDPNAESDIASNDEHLIIPEDVEVYEINGPYFFGIATKFEESWRGWATAPKCASSACVKFRSSILRYPQLDKPL